jgi:hypothetical protein
MNERTTMPDIDPTERVFSDSMVEWPDPAPEPEEQPDEPWGKWESDQEDQ